jgi:HlyD family secretion protein
MNKPSKKTVVLALVALLGIPCGIYYWNHWRGENRRTIKVSGNIELTEVEIAFKSAGRLVFLAVNEGDFVKKGTLIAKLDQEELSERRNSAQAAFASTESRLGQMTTTIQFQGEQVEGQIARARAELQQAEAALKELEAGSRAQEIETSRAVMLRAETEFAKAERDWNRAQTLYQKEDISTSQYDDFRARFESAKALLQQARQQFDLVKEGPRQENIEAARAQVQRARANLRLAEANRLELARLHQEKTARESDLRQSRAQLGVSETQLRDSEVAAPMDGVVLVKAAEPGEVLAAGTTVVTLGNLAKPWLRGYINEKDLGRVKLGTTVQVITDSFPGKVYNGKITFIASEAEFTPKQIQTQEERVKLVYRIKIEIDNPNGELKSNMPADAEIPL